MKSIKKNKSALKLLEIRVFNLERLFGDLLDAVRTLQCIEVENMRKRRSKYVVTRDNYKEVLR